MKRLVIFSILVVGCFATAQLHGDWPRYRPIKPFNFDSFSTSARVPSEEGIIKSAINPAALDDYHVRLMLDAHIVCLTELKGTKQRLADTNVVIENLKEEFSHEILDVKDKLAALAKPNVDIEKFQNQLNDNSLRLAATIMTVDALVLDSAITKQNVSETLQRYEEKMNVTIAKLKEDLRVTTQNLTDAKAEITFLKTELDDAKQLSKETSSFVEQLLTRWTATDFAVGDLIKELNVTRTEALESNAQIEVLATALQVSAGPSSIGEMPQSCTDLRQIGHVKSGLFLIMGSKNVETVYCDFTVDDSSQDKWIGYTDVKSVPVYFSVQRTTRFSSANIPIPFDFAKSFVGNAMNLTSGIFTAPRTGTYFFIFNGLAEFETSTNVIPYLAVGLFHNQSGNRIALALTEEAHTVQDSYRGQRVPLALQTAVQLKAGDQVWLEIFGKSGAISLFDNANNHSAFTGWLMDEDISL